MAKSKTDELFEMLRARGLRTRAARTLSDAVGAGRSGAATSQKAAEGVIADLRKLADELEDRASAGGKASQSAQRTAAKKARRDAQAQRRPSAAPPRRRRPRRASATTSTAARDDAASHHREAHHREAHDVARGTRRRHAPRRRAERERYPQRAFAPPPDATEVVLVRHGASAAAVPGEPFPLVLGRGDPPLSPEGAAQAERGRRAAGGRAARPGST